MILYHKKHINWDSRKFDDVLTLDEAKADIDYAVRSLRRLHPMFYHGAKVPCVDVRRDEAIKNLRKTDHITVNALTREIEGIFAKLHDAHTNIRVCSPKMRYMKYGMQHEFNGDKLVGINGMPFERILEIYPDRVSYEVPSYGCTVLADEVIKLEYLDYLGISTENGVTYDYETKAGECFSQHVISEDFLTYSDYCNFSSSLGCYIPYGKHAENFVSYITDKAHNAAVLTLTSCECNDVYKQTLKEMFTKIKEERIGNLAVDLRDNPGGNSAVAQEFIRYMDVNGYKSGSCDQRIGMFMIRFKQGTYMNERYSDLLFRGKLYLLTSNYTFSSAMLFAYMIKDNNIGKIIGEASGNDPNGYGEVVLFKLPNSGGIFQVSTKRFHRTDYIEGPVEPDIACDAKEALECFYKECELGVHSHAS